MSADVRGTKRRRKIAKNFIRLSKAHERCRQTTDGRATAYSERERELTFAKMRYLAILPGLQRLSNAYDF